MFANRLAAFFICFLVRASSSSVESADGFEGLNSMLANMPSSSLLPASAASTADLPRDFMAVDRLVKKEGYHFEKYKVVTDDDYILELHRIVKPTPSSQRGTPVFFMHGFLSVSDMYVLRGKKKDLAFQLADLGYDVWMGNARGSFYSKSHSRLPVSSHAFWDFTAHEIGFYDVPALIDRVLAMTGHSRLYYIGHSMGTTVFLIMTSMRPEYNSKIILSVLMAPVASQMDPYDINSPLLRMLLPRNELLYVGLSRANVKELFPRANEYIRLLKNFCSRKQTQPYCFDAYALVFGEHRANLDKNNFGEQISHFPAGSSLKALYHLSEVFKKGFKALDLGPVGNNIKYNSTVAPVYRLDKVSSPVAIFYATNDPLSTEKAALHIAHRLPNLVNLMKVRDGSFMHMDYILGNNTHEMINSYVIQFLGSFVDDFDFKITNKIRRKTKISNLSQVPKARKN